MILQDHLDYLGYSIRIYYEHVEGYRYDIQAEGSLDRVGDGWFGTQRDALEVAKAQVRLMPKDKGRSTNTHTHVINVIVPKFKMDQEMLDTFYEAIELLERNGAIIQAKEV